jgi:hypothetical protein
MLGIYHQVRSAVRVKEKREKTMSPAGLFSSSSSTPAMQQEEEEEEEGSLSLSYIKPSGSISKDRPRTRGGWHTQKKTNERRNETRRRIKKRRRRRGGM